jgi:hypothetical protein
VVTAAVDLTLNGMYGVTVTSLVHPDEARASLPADDPVGVQPRDD